MSQAWQKLKNAKVYLKIHSVESSSKIKPTSKFVDHNFLSE